MLVSNRNKPEGLAASFSQKTSKAQRISTNKSFLTSFTFLVELRNVQNKAALNL